jgi:glucose/arabinose dehydrogenase
MLFYTGSQFPESYRGRVFIAEHGSWNRSSRVGYRITTVTVADGRGVAYEPFAEGWLQENTSWGRPADLLQRADGSLLVSDDRQGVLYRISFGE